MADSELKRRHGLRVQACALALMLMMPGVCRAAAPGDLENAGGGAVSDGVTEPAPRITLWCSLADGRSHRLFVTDLVHIARPSPFRIWDYESRFSRVVSGAGGPAQTGGGGCRTSKSVSEATAARGALMTRMASDQWQVVILGVL
jgi:hypothetical protein